MKIFSVTLANEAASGVIGNAVASVRSQVDKIVVIHTDRRISSKLSRAVVRAAGRHTGKLFPWCNDFGAARNYALDAATEAGADWALMIDSDERFQWNGEDLRKTLSKATAPVGFVFHASGTYAQPRVFKLPVKARYDGPVHEAIQCPEFFTFGKLRLTELEKTDDQRKAKHERDLVVLTDHVKRHSTNPRWWYYLGQTLHSLERHEEAVVAYARCSALKGWNEEGAWACYRAAECLCVLKRFDEAVDVAAHGLARHAGFGECAWLASYASYWKGDMHQAILWAGIAADIGSAYRAGYVTRIGFRNLEGLYEKPWDVMYHARTALGDTAGAKEAASRRDSISGLRLGAGANGLLPPKLKPARREHPRPT
jgi:tetratricopeptide (TPR) repeat protein